ncbi:MAG TPA: protease pro-enzyme activation domain-containing protein, partial [Candidatus Acidoferrales bacterium]|nr:protease pro-enzyme activation domain-containing protein [Candidatus Acidoferrales bacterium]
MPELMEVNMRRFSIRLTCLIVLLVSAQPLMAQQPKRMITNAVDESKLVVLGGNTPPAAYRIENDRGAVADDARFEHLLLLLKRDPETEARLLQRIEAMHDPASPEFHHWLTPDQLGAQFGTHPDDVAAIQGWLESHGFTINQAFRSGILLDFSGTARQVRETFHTEIHNLTLPNGEKHVANIRDPQIPAALAA